jgi:hypothetical protein
MQSSNQSSMTFLQTETLCFKYKFYLGFEGKSTLEANTCRCQSRHTTIREFTSSLDICLISLYCSGADLGKELGKWLSKAQTGGAHARAIIAP